MFIGGCAGSTAGGLKVSRIALLGCAVRKELRRVLSPRNQSVVKFEGKVVSDETLRWLLWFNSLDEGAQLCVSYTPTDLYELRGYPNAGDMAAEDAQ